ncbi:MAG: flagellar export protein FliJ [Alphaproteobacteria bacterium]|nr:flagellar export protein FliJ [Alphaproteobacteria bacterium]
MKKPLGKLIRFHRYHLDEKRRQIKELEEAEAALSGQIDTLEDQLASERSSLQALPDARSDYGGYARAQLDRRAELTKEKELASGAVAEARDALLSAFAELKRYEITLERYEQAERQERDKNDQNELDETALQTHGRRSATALR